MTEKEFFFVAAENPSRNDNQDSADRIQRIKVKDFRSVNYTKQNRQSDYRELRQSKPAQALHKKREQP